MAAEEEKVLLGFEADLTGLREYLTAIKDVPNRVEQMAQQLSRIDISGGTLTAEQGRKLAASIFRSFEAELAGGKKFESVLANSLRQLKLGIPQEALAELRQQLTQVSRDFEQTAANAEKSAQRTRDARRRAAAKEPNQQGPFDTPADEQRPEPKRKPKPAARGSGSGNFPTSADDHVVPASAGGGRGGGSRPRPASGPDDEGPLGREIARLAAILSELMKPVTIERLNTGINEVGSGQVSRADDRATARRRVADQISAPEEEVLATQSILDKKQKLLEIEQGITAALREQAAIGRRIASELTAAEHEQLSRQKLITQQFQARLSVEEQEKLAAQNLTRLQTQAAVDPDVFAAEQRANNVKQTNIANAQKAREKGGFVGAAEAASISPRSGSQLEDTLRTTRGVAAFTVAAFPLYNVMNLATQALHEVTSGTLQYEDSLSKLGVSLNRGTGDLRGFASDLGAVANGFGLSQSAGIEAGSRATGTFGLNQQGLSDTEKQDFIRQALITAGQLNYQSGSTDLNGTQQNLAGTLRSFQLSNEEIGKLADSTTVVSKRFGLVATDLLNTTAQIGGEAHAAGFSLAQTQAIVASQATRTGQSPDAVAGFLSQVFSLADNPNVKSKFRSVGVNVEGTTLAQQTAQLAELVQQGKVSSARLNDIAAGFGRGRSSDAFRALVQGFGGVQDAAKAADSQPGAAEDIFNKLFNNINAEVRKLVGNVRGIFTEFAESGALDVLGAMVVALEKMTAVAYELLQAFNAIPKPIRVAALAMLEIAFAAKKIIEIGGLTKVFQNIQALMKSLNIFSGASRVEGAVAGSSGILGAVGRAPGANPASIAGIVEGQVENPSLFGASRRAVNSIPGGLKKGGAAALEAVGGPAGAVAIVGVLVAAGVFEAIKTNEETRRAFDRANTLGNTAGTAAELRQAAAAQQTAIRKARDEASAGFNLRTLVGASALASLTNGDEIKRAQQRADALSKRADDLEKQRQAGVGESAAFKNFQSTEDLTQALTDMSNAGFNASEQLDAVTKAMQDLTEKATSTAAAIIPEGKRSDFTNLFATAATSAVQGGIDQAKDLGGKTTTGFGAHVLDLLTGVNPAGVHADDQRKQLEKVNTDQLASDINSYVGQQLDSLGKTGQGAQSLSKTELKGLQDAVAEHTKKVLAPQLKGLDKGLQDLVLNTAVANARNALRTQFGTAANSGVTPQTIANELAQGAQSADAAFQYLSQTDSLGASKTRRDKLQAQLTAAKTQAATLNPEDARAASKYIIEAQHQLDLYNNSYAAELAAYNGAVAKTKVSRNDSGALLKNQIATAKATLPTITDPQKKVDALNQLADLREQTDQYNLNLATAQGQAKTDPRDRTRQVANAVADARRRLQYLRGHGGGALEIAQAQNTLNEALQQQSETALSLAKAKAASRVQPGDAVAAAQLALQAAKAEKGAALKGSEAYYNALVAIAQARREVAQATLTRENNADQLSIDLTDPVAQAQEAVRAARRQLAAAKSPDDRQSAQLALRQSQNQAEAAAFSQRLGDVQTAEQLGRISHESYLRYLQSEHSRLSSIAKRTRQQTDELNQIDLLMKAANDELNGQFNLGNIKLPTVYEVRRAIAAGSEGIGGIARYNAASGAVQVTDNSTKQVVLQGVPLQEVFRYIQSVLGTSAGHVVSSGGI